MTPAINLLKKLKIPHRLYPYECEAHDDFGKHAATQLGLPQAQVFKTLLAATEKGELLVAGQICFIPAGWEHEFRVLRRSRLSLLYVPTSARTAFGPLQASPLLAGLFARLPELVEEEVKGAYLTVLGQELERPDPLAARIHLAGEPDPRLLRVLDRVCHAPAIHLTLAALAADCGASVRTLNRLFLQQLGCSFRQWREQVVLGRARQLQHRGLTLQG